MKSWMEEVTVFDLYKQHNPKSLLSPQGQAGYGEGTLAQGIYDFSSQESKVQDLNNGKSSTAEGPGSASDAKIGINTQELYAT